MIHETRLALKSMEYKAPKPIAKEKGKQKRVVSS